MKNLILSLLLAVSFLSCDDYIELESKMYVVDLVVYGDCPVIKINNYFSYGHSDFYYYGLYHNVEYTNTRNIQLSNKDPKSKNIFFLIQKMTDDNTVLAYDLIINDICVLSDSTCSPNTLFTIDYTLNYE